MEIKVEKFSGIFKLTLSFTSTTLWSKEEDTAEIHINLLSGLSLFRSLLPAPSLSQQCLCREYNTCWSVAQLPPGCRAISSHPEDFVLTWWQRTRAEEGEEQCRDSL